MQLFSITLPCRQKKVCLFKYYFYLVKNPLKILKLVTCLYVSDPESRPGPPAVFPTDMEAAFASKLIEMVNKGFGLTRKLVMVKAADFCRKAGIKHPFGDSSLLGTGPS